MQDVGDMTVGMPYIVYRLTHILHMFKCNIGRNNSMIAIFCVSNACVACVQVQDLAEARKKDGLVLLINPQWQGGQAVSDFGFGPWKRRKEEFVATFQDVFFLKQFRIFGDNVRYVLC